MYEPASLGMFQCRLQRILCDFEVIMFFRKDPPQTEGRRDADPLIKTAPDFLELPTPTSPIRTLSRRHLPTYGHGLDGPRASDLPTYPTFEGC